MLFQKAGCFYRKFVNRHSFYQLQKNEQMNWPREDDNGRNVQELKYRELAICQDQQTQRIKCQLNEELI